MKYLFTLCFLLVTFLSLSQSINLYEIKTIKSGNSQGTPKKQINKRSHDKIKLLKKAKIKLDDTLEVDAEELILPDFVVKEGNKIINVKKPKQFKVKKGNHEGVITITENGVIGNIGELNVTDEGLKTNSDDKHKVLETEESLFPPDYKAPNLDKSPTPLPQTGETTTGSAVIMNGKVADILYVVDFDMYVNFGRNSQNITNFVSNLQAAKLIYYNKIGINNRIKEIQILTDTSKYYKLTSSSQALMQFTNDYATRTDVDLKHLLSNKNYGGIAYIGQIGRGKSYNTAVSGVYNTITINNDYNWSIYVVSHEEGHSYGSYHTQWCGWVKSDGTIGRIDSCYAGEPYGGNNCGSITKSPKLGGSIMSYCHLLGTLKLSLGFHPLCSDLMIKTLNVSTVPGTGDPICTSWSYSAWSPCINGYQTRTAVGTPIGCNSFPSQPLFQACSTAVSLPTVTTSPVTSITTSSASTGGNVTSDGGKTVTSRGVVWSTSLSPTVSLSTKTVNGSGVGGFVSTITGLNQNTTYYTRAYATNSDGTSYGSQVSFKTNTSTTTQTLDTTGVIYQKYYFKLALDKDTSKNLSRCVTVNSPCVFEWKNLNKTIGSINLLTGFYSNESTKTFQSGSQVKSIRVSVNGVQTFYTTTNTKFNVTVPINTSVSSLKVEFLDIGSGVYNRVREIIGL